MLIDERTLSDGSGTVISLSQDGERFIIAARNGQGHSAVSVDRAEALQCYRHPFSRSDWLDYPGVTESKVEAGLALAEARAKEQTDD